MFTMFCLVGVLSLAAACFLLVRGHITMEQQRLELERTVLEVTKEQPDILAAELMAKVEQRFNHSIHPARLAQAIAGLIDQGYLYTQVKVGPDLGGERRQLPYHGLTAKGEQRLLAA